LPASIAPVLVGAAAATHRGAFLWGRCLLCAVVALAIQVGTNYANDYSDGIRGTDAERVGPLRLVASGIATPSAVRTAALVAYGIAAAAGLVLAAQVSWWLLAVGAASLAAGWGYTGGPRPYGYDGLGELFVFAFFGLVATAGTAYCLTGELLSVAVLAGAAMGLLACALLGVNNLRDLDGDAAVGKRTLAVRLGREGAIALYVAELVVALCCALGCTAWRHLAVVVLVAVPFAVIPVRIIRGGASGRALVPALVATARLQLLAGVALAVGLWL
jgi:1,4-dihydroxy-2-naphthoate octaprenyltransferase